jgi:phosphotransferase system IIB component
VAIPPREVKFVTQRRADDAISDITEVTGVSEQARGIQFQVVMGDDVTSIGFLVHDGGSVV